jgi:nucleotide-binding universal stress UspA family protein
MTKKVLCAVDGTEHSNIAVAVAGELAKATGAELTLLAVNVPKGGVARGGIMVFAWEDTDLKRVLDGATAIAKEAGVSAPKMASVKSRDAARSIVLPSVARSAKLGALQPKSQTGACAAMLSPLHSAVGAVFPEL